MFIFMNVIIINNNILYHFILPRYCTAGRVDPVLQNVSLFLAFPVRGIVSGIVLSVFHITPLAMLQAPDHQIHLLLYRVSDFEERGT